ncbi:MAG: branched-chain amino acid ABC transporter permease, partial [Candidatus Binatia bacterium]
MIDDTAVSRLPAGFEQALGTRIGAGRVSATLLCVGLAALVPVVTGNIYFLSVATLICIYAALAQCWNLVMGVAGIWSFAQITLFAVGGYANALLMVKVGAPGGLAFVGGGVAALLAGLIIGIPSVRLRGVYVVLFTLAFQEIMRILIATDDSGFTGGTFGIYGFDAFDLGEY